MKVVGLVTEYNPFHNGHKYHLEKALEISGADYSIAVMSGHFLQRGEPALFNKWARAQMAVESGVDLILELPFVFSCRSANAFAQGAVSLLSATGVVSHICFGSEEGDSAPLMDIAQLFFNEPIQLQNLIKKHLGKGLILPLAQSKALQEYIKVNPDLKLNPDVLNNPNNILGIEYLRSLLNINSDIIPVTIKRQSAGYHDKNFKGSFASATSIREFLVRNGIISELETVLPEASLRIIKDQLRTYGFLTSDNLLPFMLYQLRMSDPADLAGILDVNEGIENRILDKLNSADSFTALVKKIKTKRYTWTRIQRILIYILMHYSKENAQLFDRSGPQYIRLLAASQKGRELLSIMREEAELPVITKVASVYKTGSELLKKMLEYDLKASDIYMLAYLGPKKFNKGIDFLTNPIIID